MNSQPPPQLNQKNPFPTKSGSSFTSNIIKTTFQRAELEQSTTRIARSYYQHAWVSSNSPSLTQGQKISRIQSQRPSSIKLLAMKQVNITRGSKHHHNTAPPTIFSPCVFRPMTFRLHCEEIFSFLISIFEIIFCSYNNTSAYLAKITTKNVIKHIGTQREVPRGSTGCTNTYLIDRRCTIATVNPTINSNSNNNKIKSITR